MDIYTTPIDEFIARQQSQFERSQTEETLNREIVKAIDQAFEDPQMAVIELAKINLSGVEIFNKIGKKYGLRYRKIERWLANARKVGILSMST